MTIDTGTTVKREEDFFCRQAKNGLGHCVALALPRYTYTRGLVVERSNRRIDIPEAELAGRGYFFISFCFRFFWFSKGHQVDAVYTV